MHCRLYKVNIFAVLSLGLPLAVEQGKKNQYSLLFFYLFKTQKSIFLTMKMEKGDSQKMTNSDHLLIWFCETSVTVELKFLQLNDK